MKGYWLILGTEISDETAQAEYGKLWRPIAEKYQARLNPSNVQPILKEARDTPRMFVVEFPSYEIAKACYADPAYQEAVRHAQKASIRQLLIFEGELA